MIGKRTLKRIALLATLVAFVGCQKEEREFFTATTQDYSATTKVHIANGNQNSIAYWDNGDQVMINGTTHSVTIEASNSNTAKIAAEGVSAYGEKYYAAYPANRATMSGSTVTFDIPYSETYTTNSSGQQLVNNIMVAKSDGTQLAFQNVGAMLHFSVKGSGNGVEKQLLAIEVSCDRPLCGQLTVDMSGSTANSTLTGSASDTARTLIFETPYTLTSITKDFYLNIPALTGATKFRVRYILKNGTNLRIYDKTKTADISFTKGCIYSFGQDIYNGSSFTFAGNDGTPVTPGTGDNPLKITSGDIFTASASYFSTAGRQFILDRDITVTSSVATLKATLDGNGHTITLGSSNSLFQSIDGGTVKNLTVDGTISSPTCVNYRFGAIACNITNATLENCINKASINCIQGKKNNNTIVGGICAYISSSSITGCRNEGEINTDARYTGGIAGQSSSTLSINGCSNSKPITLTNISDETWSIIVGGLIGNISLSDDGTLKAENCHNDGDITISGTTPKDIYCGGCFGQVTASSSFSIEQCSNTGSLYCDISSTGNMYFGGVVGTDGGQWESTMLNCYNEGDIGNSTIEFAGGLLGRSQRMSIANSYAFCNITASTAAGLVADGATLQTIVTINNCYYFGNLTSNSPSTKYGIAGSSADASHRMELTYCHHPKGKGIPNFCGTNSTSDNTCDSVLTATDAGMLTSLNEHKPTGGNGWTTGSNHIVLQLGKR